jgi:hypothetical protein
LQGLWDWLLDTATGWMARLTSPSQLVRSCIQENSVGGWTGIVKKYWAFPIFCSVILDAVITFSAYGFDLSSNIPILITYFLWTIMKWLMAAVAVYLSLKFFRLTATFGVVLACYTVVVIYAPVWTLIESGATYHQVEILSILKAQHLDFFSTGAFKFIVSHSDLFKQSDMQSYLLPISFQLESALYLIPNAFVAESIVHYLLTDKFKSYLALWLSSLIALLPTGVLYLLWDALVYRNITNAQPNLPF